MEATEKTGHNKKRIIAITAVVAVLSLAFYWLSIRPHFIKKDCHNAATGAMGLNEGDTFYATQKNADAYETYYDLCTHKAGL